MIINAEEVAKDCARAISDYAYTFPEGVAQSVIIGDLVNVIRDCIMKDPSRIAPVVQWTTDHYIQKAKDYRK